VSSAKGGSKRNWIEKKIAFGARQGEGEQRGGQLWGKHRVAGHKSAKTKILTKPPHHGRGVLILPLPCHNLQSAKRKKKKARGKEKPHHNAWPQGDINQRGLPSGSSFASRRPWTKKKTIGKKTERRANRGTPRRKGGKFVSGP